MCTMAMSEGFSLHPILFLTPGKAPASPLSPRYRVAGSTPPGQVLLCWPCVPPAWGFASRRLPWARLLAAQLLPCSFPVAAGPVQDAAPLRPWRRVRSSAKLPPGAASWFMVAFNGMSEGSSLYLTAGSLWSSPFPLGLSRPEVAPQPWAATPCRCRRVLCRPRRALPLPALHDAASALPAHVSMVLHCRVLTAVVSRHGMIRHRSRIGTFLVVLHRHS